MAQYTKFEALEPTTIPPPKQAQPNGYCISKTNICMEYFTNNFSMIYKTIIKFFI